MVVSFRLRKWRTHWTVKYLLENNGRDFRDNSGFNRQEEQNARVLAAVARQRAPNWLERHKSTRDVQ